MAKSVAHRASAWPDDVVPIAMEGVTFDLELAKFLRGDLLADRVPSTIKPCVEDQAAAVRRVPASEGALPGPQAPSPGSLSRSRVWRRRRVSRFARTNLYPALRDVVGQRAAALGEREPMEVDELSAAGSSAAADAAGKPQERRRRRKPGAEG